MVTTDAEPYRCEAAGCDQEAEECRWICPPGLEFDVVEYLCEGHAAAKGYWRDPDTGEFVQYE